MSPRRRGVSAARIERVLHGADRDAAEVVP